MNLLRPLSNIKSVAFSQIPRFHHSLMLAALLWFTPVATNAETRTWTDVPLEPVESNYQRFARAVRAGRTLEPSFAHAANLQRILDAALAAEQSKPGESFVAMA